MSTSSSFVFTDSAAAGVAGYASVDATPMGQSYAAVVPVTNTPGPLTVPFFHEHQHQQQQHQRMFRGSDLILSHAHYNHSIEQSLSRSSMGMAISQHPSPLNQHDNHQHLLMADCADSVAMAAIPAPYSPVVWNHSHGRSVERHHRTIEESPKLDDDDSKIKPIPMSDWKPAYRQNLFDDPEHPSSHNRDDTLQDDTAVPEDLFQIAASSKTCTYVRNRLR